MIGGARRFREEARRLRAHANLHPLESYDPVLARLEALVPGDGPLSERIEAFRNRYTVPKDRLNAVMDAAIAECRKRTLAHFALTDDERFTMEFVNGQPWSVYNWYKGDNLGLIQINTDLPIAIDRAIGLGHEGYPGHHVQGMNNERLYRVTAAGSSSPSRRSMRLEPAERRRRGFRRRSRLPARAALGVRDRDALSARRPDPRQHRRCKPARRHARSWQRAAHHRGVYLDGDSIARRRSNSLSAIN